MDAAKTTMAGEKPRLADERLKAANRRTGLTLAAIAVVFFFGIILTRFFDDAVVSVGVVGFAVLLYLVVAIGRHLWK